MFSFRIHTGFLVIISLLMSCGTTNPVSKKYTDNDKKIFELIERLKKDPADAESTKLLPGSMSMLLLPVKILRLMITGMLRTATGLFQWHANGR